jgi:hypothetical protein
MTTMRDHMTKLAAFHLARGKSYAKLAKCAGTMMKISNMASGADRESDVDTSEVAAELEALSACELDMADWCVSCCKAIDAGDLQKSFMGRDPGDRLRPDQISGIVGEIPADVRPIFRTGQRDFQKLSDTVDPALQKVIGVREGDL